MLEKSIVKKIKQHLETKYNAVCYKNFSSSPYATAGIPDLICCKPPGRFYAFEVKTPKGKPTPLQLEWIEKFKKAGGIAGSVKSVEDVDELIHFT